MLMQMNSTAVSSISTTINGEVTILERGSREEQWCKDQHLANNTFEDEGNGVELFRATSIGDGGRSSYIDDQDAKVVVVHIRDGRMSDWRGTVKDWIVSDATEGDKTVNGAIN